MADVEISYKGSKIVEMSASGTKTLGTAGKYCEDDLELKYTSPGGGGATLGEKSISANGVYNASSDSLDGYSKVTVAVPASAVDSGTKQITQNGNGQDVVGYAAVDVAVPNSYSAGDEGKVVSNGALVAQTSDTVTQNDTYDTTLINSLTVNVSGGGGGLTTIASGTFTGSNNSQDAGRQCFSIGNKMAKTDFYVNIWAKEGEDYPRDDNYKWTTLTVICFKTFGSYDLASDGKKSFVSASYSVDDDNSGVITAKNPGRLVFFGTYLRGANISTSSPNTFQIWRNQTGWGTSFPGFAVYIGHSNQVYPFIPVTFNYEVVYFGSDPTNDIINLS